MHWDRICDLWEVTMLQFYPGKKKAPNLLEAFNVGKLFVTHMSHSWLKYLLLLTYLRAHNPKVGGSNPSPATKNKTLSF